MVRRRRGKALSPGVLVSSLLACGASEPTAARLVVSDAYEGDNFYESGDGPPGSPRSAPPPPASAPDLFGLIGEEAVAVCSGSSSTPPATATALQQLACPTVVRAPISDFSAPAGDGSGVAFGAEAGIAGGTFFYSTEPGALRADVSAGDWHLSGTIRSIAGFGLYLAGCTQLDASAYGGISFTLWGSIGAGGSLVFFVGTAANQVSDEWINEREENAEPPNLGRCVPASGRYDGTCREPRVALAVAESPVALDVAWRDLVGGCPAPSIDPREITALAWYFPEPPDGAAYEVDIHLDDLRFNELSPF